MHRLLVVAISLAVQGLKVVFLRQNNAKVNDEYEQQQPNPKNITAEDDSQPKQHSGHADIHGVATKTVQT